MTKLKELGGSFREGKKDDSGRVSYPVVIISQGLGNLSDRNYYSKEAIQSSPAVYEGKQAYFDHPTAEDERQRPGRSVKDLCGHYENCKVDTDKSGLLILRADFVPMKNNEVIDLIEHEIAFTKKYPNDEKHFVGISINGDGEGSKMEYDEFLQKVQPSAVEMEKIRQVEGQPINVITKFTDALSADFVTSAGARGRILKEQNKKRRLNMSILESMKAFILGVEGGDKKKVEEATKALLESAHEGEDEAKKEAKGKEDMEKASKIMAHMKQCKAEMKQKEDESAEQYEARMLHHAMKKHEDECAKEAEDMEKKEQDEKKEDEAKHEDGEKKEGDDKKDEKKKDDADDEDAEESEDESKKEDDDAGHDDADADKKLVKKMVKPDSLKQEIEALKKEIESLKKGKQEAEEEADEKKKESAKAKIELAAKERMILVEGVLSKCGLPRPVTEEVDLRGILIKAKNKEEMTKLATAFKEVWLGGSDIRFGHVSSVGFPEMTSNQETKTTDELFK